MTEPAAMPSEKPVIAIDNVTRRFANGVIAMEGVSFTVAEGAFLSIAGPSGCGKSTLLSLMAGLMVPDEGDVRVRASRRGDVALVFQDATLMPWASVAENVALPLKLLHTDRAAIGARVAEALDRVSLTDFARAVPRELSGGMRMRVAIARALVTRPRVLLLDEPFAALDEMTREAMNDELLRLWAEIGFTCVFVTHSLYEAVYLSQRLLVMTPRPGRIAGEIAIGAPYPRGEAWRADPAFGEARARASGVLRRAAGNRPLEAPPPDGAPLGSAPQGAAP
jgi:NitT/TauT family transport system ATP-binding protein